MGCGSSKVNNVTISAHQKLDSPISNGNPPVKVLVESSSGEKNDAAKAHVLSDEPYGSLNALTDGSADLYKQKRKKLMPSVDIFKEVDERALSAPSSLKSSVSLLTEYLSESCKDSNLLKFRAIWTWITHNVLYDVDTFFNSDEKGSAVDVDTVLDSGKAVCSGYAAVCQVLAENIGLKMETVTGWAKGFSYSPGMNLCGKEINHAWNAVYLDDSWWLFDATWGAGYIDSNKNFIQETCEHYFLTDPKEYIFDHFPEESQWQLLDTPVSKNAFENMAKFSRYFFQLNMRPVTHVNSAITNDKGKVHFKFKTEKEQPIKCVGTLCKTDGKEPVSGQYLHTYTTGKVLHVLVSLPHEGEYDLDLFAGISREDSTEKLPLICSYKINCTANTNSNFIYPKQYKKWSPGFYLYSPTEGRLVVENTYKFRIALPKVIEMAVCLGGANSSWLRLPNMEGTIWEGDLFLPKGTERVNVLAKFANQTNSTFSSVLEYQVVNEK